MLAQASVVGFIPVHDFDLAEGFYAGKLGLTVASRDPFALVLTAAGDVMIRCVLTPEFKPQPYTVFGWEVLDITVSAKALNAAGVETLRYPWFEQDADGVWTAPGGAARVAWFNDPFGNVLSLSQHKAATA
ncbi:VOC family protein [Granulicella tundricola]|uniref:Glyoxalase family protein n=1 Tax=Granulicella tundricola (strain ATCC BAA-1859 / DSM 23138 / MP5ACTX9) TaxID=1198114 RepID=E8WVW2_GRATM|nr:glyoxalase/bleomycin resistance/dioxygenase family protein [Granulicella tundricola]ADW70721.1 glyoxalase family protein [Granulicella tundricola MP5ACTX9]